MANAQDSAKVKDLDSGDWEDQSYQWDASRNDRHPLPRRYTRRNKDQGFETHFHQQYRRHRLSGKTGIWKTGRIFLKSPAQIPLPSQISPLRSFLSTKGWMWFDHYPWVYSEVEKGWLYFYPTGSKVMTFSSNDQAWREME